MFWGPSCLPHSQHVTVVTPLSATESTARVFGRFELCCDICQPEEEEGEEAGLVDVPEQQRQNDALQPSGLLIIESVRYMQYCTPYVVQEFKTARVND